MSNHKPDCQDPFHCEVLTKRITVSKGKQKLIRHTYHCPNCGAYEKVFFTDYSMIEAKIKAFGNLDRKFSSEEIEEIRRVTGLTLEKPTSTVYLTYKQRVKADPINFSIQTKEISNEESLASKIKGLRPFYKTVILKTRCYSKRYGYKITYEKPEDFGWNPRLVNRFLATKPTQECLARVFMGPNLLLEGFTASALRGKRRNEAIGHIINKGDGWGYMKSVNYETYIAVIMLEIEKRNEMMRAAIKKKARQKKKKLPMLPLLA